MKKKQYKLILSFFGGKSKPSGRRCSSCAEMVSLSLMVLKRRRIIERKILWAFWRIFPLREGKEGASQPSS